MVIETWYSQDVKRPVQVHYVDGNVFSQDNLGNKIGVVLMDGETPFNVSGTISANVIRSDGTTVAVTGASSNNTAWVVLPQAAYAVPGLISVVIKSTDSGTVTTLCAVVGTVYQSSTDAIVDPGTIIPSVQNLIDDIETAVASIPADYSNLWASLAPNYDSTSKYEVGQYVTYDGAVYRCVVQITSGETWTAAHWAETTVGTGLFGVTQLTNGVVDSDRVTYITKVDDYTSYNMTFTRVEEGLAISGGTTGSTANRFYDGLNGQNTTKTSSSEAVKILKPGTYAVRINVVRNAPSNTLYMVITTSTIAASDRLMLVNGDVFTITNDAGAVLRISGGTAFGTASDPTVIDYGVDLITARDDVARDQIRTLDDTFGFYWEEPVRIVQGSISATTGADTANNYEKRLRTGFCLMENGFRVVVPSGWVFAYFLYSTADTSGFIRYSGMIYEDFETRMLPSDARYVRFWIRKSDDSDIVPADATGFKFYKFISDVNVVSYEPDLGIVQGSMNDSGGDSSQNYEKRLRTGFIPFDPLYGFSMEVPDGWRVNYFLYTSNNASSFFYESPTNSTDYRMAWDGAESAKYVRFWIRKTDDSDIVPADATGIVGTFYLRNGSGSNGGTGLLYPNGADQTAEIQQMLSTGRCDLAPGTFLTTGVIMPDGSVLSGSGDKTRLTLTGTGAGKCVTLGKNCTVTNIGIVGSTADIQPSSTIGNRHGIYAEGTGTSDTSWRCNISGVYATGFTGGGITLYDIGYGQGANISDCYCYSCCVGLYIKRISDFIHVTNCTFSGCYYACINNGGNNQFSCCSFVSSSYGLMMGDTSGTDYPNNSHGACSCCNFGHNTIRAIYMNNMASGFAFGNCNISENGAEIISSYSVTFSGCVMLSSFSLTVNGGGVVLFDGDTFRNNFADNISITGNNRVHFHACYYQNGNVCNPV